MSGTFFKPNYRAPESKRVRSFFDSIAERYDFLNEILSLGLVTYWRRSLRQEIHSRVGGVVLDLGTGTGDSLKQFSAAQWRIKIGCDFSFSMLLSAKKRLKNNASLAVGDFHCLPFKSDVMDLVTGSFMLRSASQPALFLRETKRVLRQGGQFAFLELTRPPEAGFYSFFFRIYLRYWVPFMGWLCSGNREAYRFLSESVQWFVDSNELRRLMECAGFQRVQLKILHGGLATIITGEK